MVLMDSQVSGIHDLVKIGASSCICTHYYMFTLGDPGLDGIPGRNGLDGIPGLPGYLSLSLSLSLYH